MRLALREIGSDAYVDHIGLNEYFPLGQQGVVFFAGGADGPAR